MTKTALAAWALICAATPVFAQTDIANEIRDISTPNEFKTTIGTLQFNQGRPTPKTVVQVYDQLDFIRGVEVFLNAMPGASMVAMRRGQRSMGAADNTFVVFEQYLDSKTLFLTGATDSIYASSFLDLSKGPVVLEYPPRAIGVLDDMWSRHIADFGDKGPDKGKGGKFLIVPPGYKGKLPSGYHLARSRTNGVWAIMLGLGAGSGDQSAGVMQILQSLKVYPLAAADNPPAVDVINASGNVANLVQSNGFSFFEDIASLVQEDPADVLDPELTGQLAAIGIVKDKPFAPDERMKRILTEAAAIGSASARTMFFKPRDPAATLYPDSAWTTPLVGGSTFLRNGVRLFDARTAYHYGHAVVAPSLMTTAPGAGMQFAVAAMDANGDWLDGGKLYRLQLPANVPAKESWSITLYDPQTRSLLQTEALQPSLSSLNEKLKPAADGSYELWFGPKAPTGKEDSFLRTAPGKGWFAILRLRGPTKPWFDKTWRPGEFEAMK
ncbi:DUF1254 domain-containing protein [Rhodoplanes sp. Z2-YC6860]|uniref:DUF1254 domain-containing protein n=1 Tax=Rhodoplanes sp. Z2-YC6860 TaxID=674703 RepID=UPI00078C4D39|nr:DUF1254 domain-containing protein [Rhodoplanes sp. Z2-YC6860]AMN40589.1 hypothetical protein RHPLAN_21490 [Rhodoplanes sp. Z2-YC6860]